MKTLVKVLKVEDGYTYYQEISRKTGKVMIEDYMSTEQFDKALNLGDYGFQLVDDLIVDLTAQSTKSLKECKTTLNLFRKTSVSGLVYGTAQKVDLGKGFWFLKDTPNFNEDGTSYYSYTVIDRNGDIVEAGSALTLKNLKLAAKNAKR